MKAVRLHDYGLDKLIYEDAPVPEIKENQILVKVAATSVNHLETIYAAGKMKDNSPLNFPWIPGFDFAGYVETAPEGSNGLKKGDKVYGNCIGGSYAEYLAADLDKVVLMPENLSFVEASSVPHVAETAWQAVHTYGNVNNGQKVLIQGGAGAVGGYAVQFAHLAGAFVYATAATSDIEFVKSLNADVVIDYKTEDFTRIAKDVDLVLDFVGGKTQDQSYKVLKQGGRLVTTVALNSEEEAKEHCIIATAMYMQQSAQNLETITRLINEGKIKTDVASVYPLKEALTAWDNFLGTDITVSSKPHGKIVLQTCDSPEAEANYGKDSDYIREPEELPGENQDIVNRTHIPLTDQPLKSEWEEGE